MKTVTKDKNDKKDTKNYPWLDHADVPGDLTDLDGGKTHLSSQTAINGEATINGWVILFALLNVLMGLVSLTTLQKVSSTDAKIAQTNAEMVKIRIVLEERYKESKTENIALKQENLKIKNEINTVNDRLETIENKLRNIGNSL